ncbi:hypothetical protein AMTRI_Chr10g450 [Amborella trichopoda]|uniref:SNAP25 homologous protein SNAP33 n=1 Tax=Amborella trichopoda TaxID=13333 RepID=UPI0005D2EAB4|nr:SNAP25 homologous protein SNAP33 [Amborella trichopoda]|eukprot:XP_011621093.1 SNAP25 homologous protein SNAP33 [Amborella trichopoda]
MSRPTSRTPPKPRVFKHSSGDFGSSNPFDSDSESDSKPPRTSSAPVLDKFSKNPFDDDDAHLKGRGSSSTNSKTSSLSRNPFSDGEEDHETPSIPKKANHRTPKSDESSYRIRGGKFVSHVKDKALSVGESAMKTAEKLKESSVLQAQKITAKKTKGEINLNPDFDIQNREQLFDEGERNSSSTTGFSIARNHYKNDFRDSGGLENQTVEELEKYAVYKSEETTTTVNNCLKIAGEMKEDATRTLITLHQQGEQIHRTHLVAADIDHDLSKGEKLLGSLGGIFSKTWKPKKTRAIMGPTIVRDDSFKRRGNHLEQRERLGLSHSPKGRSSSHQRSSAPPGSAFEQIELQKGKQDDALSDLSNMLGELKDMALDMGSEIEGQNKALDNLNDDVDELGFRVKNANLRGRHLLRK